METTCPLRWRRVRFRRGDCRGVSVDLEFVVPSPDLSGHVTLFYHFRTDLPRFEDTERAGHAQVRFRLAGSNASYRFANDEPQITAPIHLIGPTTAPMLSAADGPVEVVGMGLSPAGWAALVRADASTMINRSFDASELFVGIEAVADAMAAASGTAAKVAILETFVRRTIAGTRSDALLFVAQVDSWLADNPSPQLEVLEAATGLSRRQVERRCNTLYGAPPKVLARKYRALRAAVAMVADGESVDEVLARGFYDQSHLIREIKQFTGCTPRQLRANPDSLARLTIGGRSALEGRVIPLVSES